MLALRSYPVNLPNAREIARQPPPGLSGNRTDEYYRNVASFNEVKDFILLEKKRALERFSREGSLTNKPRNHPLRGEAFRVQGYSPVEQARSFFPNRLATAFNEARRANDRDRLIQLYEETKASINQLDALTQLYRVGDYRPLRANNFNDVVRNAILDGLDNPPQPNQERIYYEGDPLEGMYDQNNLYDLLNFFNTNTNARTPFVIRLGYRFPGSDWAFNSLGGWLSNELNNVPHRTAGSDVQLEDIAERAEEIEIVIEYRRPEAQGAGYNRCVTDLIPELIPYLTAMYITNEVTLKNSHYGKPCLLNAIQSLYMARNTGELWTEMVNDEDDLDAWENDYAELRALQRRDNDYVLQAFRSAYGSEMYVIKDSINRICRTLHVRLDVYTYQERDVDGKFEFSSKHCDSYPFLGRIMLHDNHYMPVVNVKPEHAKAIQKKYNMKCMSRRKFTTIDIMEGIIQGKIPTRKLLDGEIFDLNCARDQKAPIRKMDFRGLGLQEGVPDVLDNIAEPPPMQHMKFTNEYRCARNVFAIDFETYNRKDNDKAIVPFLGCLWSPNFSEVYFSVDELMLKVIPRFIEALSIGPSELMGKDKKSYFIYETVCIAHNLSFEFRCILANLSEGIDFKVTKIMGDPSLGRMEVKGCTIIYKSPSLPHKIHIKLLDSKQISSASLEDSATCLGLSTKLPYDYEWFSNEDNIKYLQSNNWLLPLERAHEITVSEYGREGNLIAKRQLDMSKYKSPDGYRMLELIAEYCMRDSRLSYEVLVEYMKSIFKVSGEDMLGMPTMPSIAWKLLKSSGCLPSTVKPVSGLLNEMLRANTIGGRTGLVGSDEPIVCEEPVTEIDVNSLYPYAMSCIDIPVGNPVRLTDLRMETLSKYPFYEACITVTKSKPFEVCEPRGNGDNLSWNRCATKENPFHIVGTKYLVQRLEEDGCEFHITDAIVWTSVIKNGLRPFIDYYNEQKVYYSRLEKSENHSEKMLGKIMRQSMKLIMNSSYGKFGQKSYPMEALITTNACVARESIHHSTEAFYEQHKGRYFVYRPKTKFTPSKSYVHIAQSILDQSKLVMSRQIRVLQQVGCKCLYSDTDSLFITRAHEEYSNGVTRLDQYRKIWREKYNEDPIDSERLGAMKIELDNCPRSVFICAKTYMCEAKPLDNVRMKGVPKRILHETQRKSGKDFFEFYRDLHIDKPEFVIPFSVRVKNGSMYANSITRQIQPREPILSRAEEKEEEE